MRAALAFLFAALGFGIGLWYGESWLALPHYSEAQIQQTAQMNLLLAMKNQPAAMPLSHAQINHRLQQEHKRVVAALDRQRKQTITGFVVGLVLIALGAMQFLLSRIHRPTAN